MRWNPYVNALGATGYVWGVALLIHYIASLNHDTPDNLVGSVAALSLLVFSASVMAFLLFYRPVALLIENKKHDATIFLLKTLGAFGLATLLVVLAVL